MNPFFQTDYVNLVDSPNNCLWWHSMPLPDGNRISGQPEDKDLQFKMWRTMQIADGGLAGKRVLDIGANDGFFTIGAVMAGAREVTAVNSEHWSSWPQNIQYACDVWQVQPRIVTADFRTCDFHKQFDVIFFLGVLYHLEDVFTCMKTLRRLLTDQGVMYLETQMARVQSDVPVFEYASDVYQTVAIQDKSNLDDVGISNYLFPNELAIRNLAHSYDFECESLSGPHNRYTQDNPTRGFYKLVKRSS